MIDPTSPSLVFSLQKMYKMPMSRSFHGTRFFSSSSQLRMTLVMRGASVEEAPAVETDYFIIRNRLPSELLVLRLKHLPPTAFAYLTCDMVMSQRLADHEGTSSTSTAGEMQ